MNEIDLLGDVARRTGVVRRLQPADTPEKRSKRVSRLHETINIITDSAGHTIGQEPGKVSDVKAARVVLVVWMDDDGHGGWAQHHLRPGWADEAGQAETDNARAFSRLVSEANWNPYSNKAGDAIARVNQSIEQRNEERAKTAAAFPWQCEFCSARFGSQRGAEQHEKQCLGSGPRGDGRHGHRSMGGQLMPNSTGAIEKGNYWRQTCSCGAYVTSLYRDRKRAFVKHADETQASLLELPAAPPTPPAGLEPVP